MGKPGRTPSIVPNDHDRTIYLVMDKYKSGSVWHQTDAERSDLEAVIMGMQEGKYQNPVRVVGFNVRVVGGRFGRRSARTAPAL